MFDYLVYPGEIATEKSIVNLINGNGSFWVENPYFAKNVNKSVDPKKWLDEYVTNARVNDKASEKYIISAPRIYIKNTKTGDFTTNFFIRWTSGGKKNYTIWGPFNNKVNTYSSTKLQVTPMIKDDSDAKLLVLHHQLSMVLEVLIVSKIFDIDLSGYSDMTDNQDFYDALIGEINEKLKPIIDGKKKGSDDDLFTIDEDMVNDFNTPPVWTVDPDDDIKVPCDGELVIRYHTLLQELCGYIKSRLGSSRVSVTYSPYMIYNKILKSKVFKQFHVIPNYSAVAKMDKVSGQVKPAFESNRCEFRCQNEFHKNGTKLKTSRTNTTVLTNDNISMLWGGDRGKMLFSGCLYLTLSYDTRLYPTGKGTFTVTYGVSEMWGQLCEQKRRGDFEDNELCDEIFGDDITITTDENEFI